MKNPIRVTVSLFLLVVASFALVSNQMASTTAQPDPVIRADNLPRQTSNTNDTSAYHFDLDAAPTNSSVSPKLFGLNFIWPFVQYDPGIGQVLDQEVKTAFSGLNAANFYRFPGGQWSEWYQWYWGIGPQQERPWTAIPPARQPLPNTFGTIEFLETMKHYGSQDAMFTINYLTGNYTTTQKWIEFVNGPYPSDPVSETWTTDCWGDAADECWRTKRPLTVTQVITAGANTVVVSPSAISQLGFYLDPNEFDPDLANCDPISIDGYGQDGCEGQVDYEYKKLSLNVNDEWMIVERVDGNTLTVRRANEMRDEHAAGSIAYFWDYANLENAPTGYFAWLRSQPEFGGQREPYGIHYWEVGNEPFWAVFDGDGDGTAECNYWFPCVEGKSSPDEQTRLDAYTQFYNQVAEHDDRALKFGLDLRAYVDFSNLDNDFANLDCPTILQGWNRAALDGIDKTKIGFVAPHFYVWADSGVDNLALVTHPDRFFNYFVQLDACLESEFVTKPEIVLNEFGLFYNEDRAFGWWSELGDDAGKWRDGLFLASLLAQSMELENITGANYWNLIWPGFLGKPGDQVYPFEDHFVTGDFTARGPTFDLYRYLVKFTFDEFFVPAVESAQGQTVGMTTGNGANRTLSIEPLLVYATRSRASSSKFSLFVINRSESSLPVSVTIDCDTCIRSGDILTQIALEGAAYDSADLQIHAHTVTPEDLDIAPGTLTYHGTIPPLSVVILVKPDLELHKQATPADGVRNSDVVTYTLTLGAPGLDVRLRDPLPPAAQYISGTLTGTVSPPAIYSPTENAIIWQGSLAITDTLETIHFQVTPGLTGSGSLSLSLPILNTAWLTDTESGRSVSATVIVNGWRVYLPLVQR